MLSRLRKKTEAAASQVPAWHPNFRNYDRLPDVKVVRTTFFINGIAILVAVTLLVYLGMREYELRSLKVQVARADAEIAENKKESDEAVRLYGLFQEEERRVNEIDAFIRSKPLVSEYLRRFGETLPDNVSLSTIEMGVNGVTIRGGVRGTPDQAAGDANAYVNLLKRDKFFSQRFEDPKIIVLSRNPAEGGVVFEFLLKYKPGKETKS